MFVDSAKPSLLPMELQHHRPVIGLQIGCGSENNLNHRLAGVDSRYAPGEFPLISHEC